MIKYIAKFHKFFFQKPDQLKESFCLPRNSINDSVEA